VAFRSEKKARACAICGARGGLWHHTDRKGGFATLCSNCSAAWVASDAYRTARLLIDHDNLDGALRLFDAWAAAEAERCPRARR
jgi:hypothetical protein